MNIRSVQEHQEEQAFQNDRSSTQVMAKVLQEGGKSTGSAHAFVDGYWIYHTDKVNVTNLFSQPEDKLWLVVQDYQGGLESESYNLSATKEIPLKRGFKIEKNSVIKLGRVRLRVRDLDTSDKSKAAKKQEKVKNALLTANKEKTKEANASIVDINEIELIEEAQNKAQGVGPEKTKMGGEPGDKKA
jgi:hypothetical protein